MADLGAFRGLGVGFAQGGFDLVDPRDGGEWSGGEGLAGLEGFVELAPGVGPAGTNCAR